MSIRREFDDDDKVEALRYDLETLASQARVDAVVTESFAAALERRLMSHAPRVAVSTGGAAARDPPPDDESDVSSQSGDDDESPQEDVPDPVPAQQSENNEGETASDESRDDTLASEEIDGVRLTIDDIREESETIERLLARKSSLSTDDLDAIIRRERELLAAVRAMREKLNI